MVGAIKGVRGVVAELEAAEGGAVAGLHRSDGRPLALLESPVASR